MQPNDKEMFARAVESRPAAEALPEHCIIDTNVVITFLSPGDIIRAVEDNNTALFEQRCREAFEALVLVWWLGLNQEVAGISEGEMIDVLSRRIDGGDQADLAYTAFMVDLNIRYAPTPHAMFGSLLEFDHRKSGNEVDRQLVHAAADDQVVLISREQTPKGAMARAARQRGAKVVTPAAFLQQHSVDTDGTWRQMLQTLRSEANLLRSKMPELDFVVVETCLRLLDHFRAMDLSSVRSEIALLRSHASATQATFTRSVNWGDFVISTYGNVRPPVGLACASAEPLLEPAPSSPNQRK